MTDQTFATKIYQRCTFDKKNEISYWRLDRAKHEEVCRRAGIKRKFANRADLRELRWFGYVERVDKFHMYGQKGVNGRSKSRTGMKEIIVMLDG